MKSYVQALLYVYPKLKTIERDLETHIRNKALLSYRFSGSADELCERLIGDIEEKKRVEDLERVLESIIGGLTTEERFLLEFKYFGRQRRLSEYWDELGKRFGSERQYYRRQERLLNKLCSIFERLGLTEENFQKNYGEFKWLTAIWRRLESGKTVTGIERSSRKMLNIGGEKGE